MEFVAIQPSDTPPRAPPSLEVIVRATGGQGLPDTYLATEQPTPSPINVGTDWIFSNLQAQTKCYGVITDIRALTHDLVEYVVRCAPPTPPFFLFVRRDRTRNHGGATLSLRMLRPHLRDAQRYVAEQFPWHTPYDAADDTGSPHPFAPTHLQAKARCVSRSETAQHPSTWRLVHANGTIRIGCFIDLHDIDDPRIPVGPVKVAGIRNVEQSWAEFIVQIHPHFTRTNNTFTLLAAPLEHSSLPENLEFVHSTVRHRLPNVHGDTNIFPAPPPPTVIRRIRSALSGLRMQE